MPNLPTKLAGGRAGGAPGGGFRGVAARRAYAGGYRLNRIDRWSRTRREPNRPNRVHPWLSAFGVVR
eukprot:15483229-Alexandrium_andersonii.AAC.1